MTSQIFSFTTGSTTLPDVGVLSYNGCTFSPLYESKVAGKVVKDEANRTTKYMEYMITVDGYVTLTSTTVAGIQVPISTSIAPTMATLRSQLTAQGGELSYQGRGFDLLINAQTGNAGGTVTGIIANVIGQNNKVDVAWGPIPELLEFQPLGGGLSAKIQWRVTVRVTEVPKKGQGLLQLNYETSVSYGEDGFSSLSLRGVIEIPMTRAAQTARTLLQTVDNFRAVLETRILTGIDLSRFRITRREFPVSRDKRTMEWSVEAEEKPYMDLPPDCTVARGTFSVKPAKAGMGLVVWLCTLRATYTVRADKARRTAWLSFLSLLRLRMQAPETLPVPKVNAPAKPFQKPNILQAFLFGFAPLGVNNKGPAGGVNAPGRKVWLIDFSVEEGLYLDSKVTSFSATWRLITSFSNILLASGLWKKVKEKDKKGDNLWATSVKDIMGTESWFTNRLDPSLDIVVDFGGPDKL